MKKKQLPTVTDRELEIMEVIWSNEAMSAQAVAAYFLEPAHGGYSKNTTYTFLKRLVDKGILLRSDPGFFCTPLYTREQVQRSETASFLERMYHGSLSQLVVQFMQGEQLSEKEIREMKEIIDASLKEETNE